MQKRLTELFGDSALPVVDSTIARWLG